MASLAHLHCSKTTLDRAVDRLCRAKGFASERERVEHLFMLYEKIRAPLTAVMKTKPKRPADKTKIAQSETVMLRQSHAAAAAWNPEFAQ